VLNRSMLRLLVVFAILAASSHVHGEKDAAPDLQSDLTVGLEKGQIIQPLSGNVRVELRFENRVDNVQKFTNEEYRIDLLDKNGRQMKGALVLRAEPRNIILKGRSTIDKPGVVVVNGELKANEDYYLVVGIRNLVGHVKFTAAAK
jgi:hypothetical protein